MKKYTTEQLYKMDAIDVYKLVLKGDYIKRFPRGFWQQPEALQNAKKCTKFLIEDILKLNDDELREQLSSDLFIKHKLNGMLQYCFNSSPFNAINSIYEGKFKQWEFKVAPSGFWTTENGIKATRWLVEEHLQLNDEELKESLSRELFEQNGLRGMLRHCFEDSPFKAIDSVYPNKYKKTDFKNYFRRLNGLYRYGKI